MSEAAFTDLSAEQAQLEESWKKPRGLRAFFTGLHHTEIGLKFIVTAFVFFAAGGVEALLMRLQLAKPENTLLGPDMYNQVFTMHGTTMMFLFAVPVMEGFALYLVPLMVGSRQAAFPRLNAYAYWTFLIGGILLYAGFALDFGPDAGWFAYTPLSGPAFSPGKRVDVWAQMITFTELSALAGAVNTVATVFTHRAPGMSLNRMPLFVWAALVMSFMVIFAMPAVMLASGALALDRLVGTHFFNPAEGGDPILWQHLFWFFGHPEVYIIFVPATGFVSSLITAFSRRRMFGYTAMVLALIATGFIGFGLWVHHMFTTGLPQLGQSFFTAASMMIAVPSGVQIFCWIATLRGGRLQFRAPLYFALGFIAIFVLGGLSGMFLASVPIDLQVHDTYFVVAHFHYVLIGGAVFPLIGAVYYWFPKMTGRMMNDRLGKVSFWLLFVGFNLTFFPMHWLGLQGMPRRVYTYLAERGWTGLNQLATVGGVVLGVGLLVTLWNALVAARSGALAGDDPWGADSLEWSTGSPPPPYNFLVLPTVRDNYARWSSPPNQPVVTGVRSDEPEVLMTRLLDAEPSHREVAPKPTIWPFILAVGTAATFIIGIFTPWSAVIGGVIAAFALIGWFWPKGKPHDLLEPAR
jgi:cytochrome c oxidase subunit I+III